ncbi:MAG TPA: hypothetical protein VFQ91_00125 [Bryobacteraceae bacterium]|nr:hypothetical protein [Bryobacteraceae bacterium]
MAVSATPSAAPSNTTPYVCRLVINKLCAFCRPAGVGAAAIRRKGSASFRELRVLRKKHAAKYLYSPVQALTQGERAGRSTLRRNETRYCQHMRRTSGAAKVRLISLHEENYSVPYALLSPC